MKYIILLLFCIVVLLVFIFLFSFYCIHKYRLKITKKYYSNDLDLYNLFTDINGFVIKKHDTYNLTYGEITPKAIDNIKTYLENNKIKPDIFIDLGCGAGKSLVMAKYKGFKECYGIEIVKERYDEAMKLHSKLDPEDKKSIHIFNDDLFNFNKLIKIDDKRHYTVFISNLLFSKDLNDKIWKYLNEILPKNSIIVVSQKFVSDPIDYIDTPMSWSEASKCHIYKIN